MFESMSQTQVKRLTAIHGWSGTILGILLYAITITGAVVVLAHEIGVWSVGGEKSQGALSSGLHDKIAPRLNALPESYLEHIGVGTNDSGEVFLFPHYHTENPRSGQMDDYGVVFRIDGNTGEIITRNEGFISESQGWFGGGELENFLVDLHVQLYVPNPWGLILTGILGLAMMGAGVTGVIIHRHVLRDIFVAQRPGDRLVSRRDRHVLAGSWSLPFAFVLGFTGAFFSFAISIGIPIMAMIAFGGDQEKMIEALVEVPGIVDETPVAAANLDRIVQDAEARAGQSVRRLEISHFGRADSLVIVNINAADGDLNGVQYVYSGATGAFQSEKQPIGSEPSAGGFLVSLMGVLHFGTFAGLLSKFAWVGLGAAMCFVIITGMRMWVKRREEDPAWQRFGRIITTVTWGTPIAMVMSAYGFFLTYPGDGQFIVTPTAFFVSAGFLLAYGYLSSDDEKLNRRLMMLLAVLCLALPIFRMAMGGTPWAFALQPGYLTVISLDIAFFLIGGALIGWRKLRRLEPQTKPHIVVAEPAE